MTAIDLAKRGARVILACRSRQRGEAALADVKRVCPNEKFIHCDSLWFWSNLNKTVVASPCLLLFCLVSPQESGSSQVLFMQLDLGSLKSVRSFAENFLRTEPRLDLLINNAG